MSIDPTRYFLSTQECSMVNLRYHCGTTDENISKATGMSVKEVREAFKSIYEKLGNKNSTFYKLMKDVGKSIKS